MIPNEERHVITKWFDDSANWLVLFVHSREEQRVVNYLQYSLDSEKYNPFVPTRDFAFNTGNRKIEIQKKPLFRGYVFIAATVSKAEFLATVEPIIKRHHGIYRLLSNGIDVNDVMLTEHDKTVMCTLLDENCNVPAMKAVFVGDTVQIIDESLRGMVGTVKRIDTHKRYTLSYSQRHTVYGS